MKNDLDYAVQLLNQADGILITAGAGMSVDSGLPDFRGYGGLYNHYPTLEKAGLAFSYQQLLTPATYLKMPQLAYWFWGHCLQQFRQAEPHEGYRILKRWADCLPHGAFVFTSNIDGMFQKAGFADEQVYEVHGTSHRLQCFANCENHSWRVPDNFEPELDDEQCLALFSPPLCPVCDGEARDNILMFNDYWFCDSHYAPKYAALQKWLATVQKLVVIELGAGKSIPTVRQFSERTAKQKKAKLIRINPFEAQVPKPYHLGLEQTALAALKALDLAVTLKTKTEIELF